MIEVSSRYGLAIAILVTLALLPEFVHRGGRFLREDCRDPKALLQRAENGVSDAPPALERLQRQPGTQLASRRLPLGDGRGYLDLHVVHAFNPGMLYRPAEFYFVEAKPERRETEMLEHDGVQLPVHRAYWDLPGPRRGRPKLTVTGYLQVFDAKPVASGYRAELWAGASQLFSGRQPVWLFFVHGEVDRGAAEEAERVLHEALASAWDDYRAACLP